MRMGVPDRNNVIGRHQEAYIFKNGSVSGSSSNATSLRGAEPVPFQVGTSQRLLLLLTTAGMLTS